MPDLSLAIHVGAHKTATTHLQHALSKARGRLRQQGVTYFGPELLRGKLRLPRLTGKAVAPPDALMEAFYRNRKSRLVLSEENILGTTRADMVAKGACFYPNAATRLSRLLQMLNCQDATIYLGIRAPLAFLTSAHGQQQNAGRFDPMESYIRNVTPEALRWSELVARLGAVPGVARMVVWRFEDYPTIAPAIFDDFLGPGRAEAVVLPDRARLVGTSAQAIAHARAALQADPARDVTAAIREARALFPESEEFPGPAPFGADQLAADRARYAQDCAVLAQMPGVTWLPAVADDAGGSKPA
jgi:hypothetical protein